MIQAQFLEENDLLTILNESIEKVDIVKDAIVYVDEFAGFTKQEYLVLEKIMKLAKQVITLKICLRFMSFTPYIILIKNCTRL